MAKKKQKELDRDLILAFLLFFTYLSISFLSNFTYNFLNRPAYALTTSEKIFAVILMPIAYFGLIGLIYLEIKLTRKKFFDKIMRYWLRRGEKS
jgi:hypothetical protein